MEEFEISGTAAAMANLERASADLNADIRLILETVIQPAKARYRRLVLRPTGRSRERVLAVISASDRPGRSLDAYVSQRLGQYFSWKRMCVAAVQYERIRTELGLEGVLWFRRMHAGVSNREQHDILLHFLASAAPGVPLQRTLRAYRETFGGSLIVVQTRKQPGRKPIGIKAMTAAERQRRHRKAKISLSQDNAMTHSPILSKK